MVDLGKTLVAVGLGLIVLGGLFVASDAFPALRLGRLPGDVRIERPGMSLYFPVTTMLIISALLSATLYFIARLKR